MFCVRSKLIQCDARFIAQRDVRPAGGIDDLAEAFVTSSGGDDDSLDATIAGSQGFQHWQNAVDMLHSDEDSEELSAASSREGMSG